MALNEKMYHIPVLVERVIETLDVQPGHTYVDATFGGGGHTRAILLAEPSCTVIALDWDQKAIETNAPAVAEEFGNRFRYAWGNFAHVYRILNKMGVKKVDGFLADFGTSQHQIFKKEGFSFLTDTPLDMRMSKGHHYFKASDILNRYTAKSLAKVFREYSEEPFAMQIAKAIVEERKTTPFKTTKQLAQLIQRVIPMRVQAKKRTHPATRVFQALRIYVNKELENIEIFLKAAVPFLNPGGRLVCISFHSLEDRIVKTFFRENQDTLETLTKKPLTATDEEVDINPSARSAKLRAAQKRSHSS